MQTGDILDLDYVLEVGGVQTVFSQSWLVDTYLGPHSDAQIISDHAAQLHATFTDVVTDEAILSCVKMINRTSPAKTIVFPNLAGTALGGSHPPHQVVRVDLYGKALPADPIWRNANNLSGVAESLSTRGRINDPAPFADYLSFFTANQQTDPNGAILRAQIKQWTGGTNYNWFNVSFARLCESLEILRSRKFELCV